MICLFSYLKNNGVVFNSLMNLSRKLRLQRNGASDSKFCVHKYLFTHLNSQSYRRKYYIFTMTKLRINIFQC